jgi:MFS family permease
MRGMITLALLDIFKNKYDLQPATTSAYLSYVNLPWSQKLLYGIFTDTFPIFGSRKKSYIILCGTIQCLTNLAIAVYDWHDASAIMLLAMVNSGSGAVMDVVVDGLMVIMSRKDPNFGSEDLQTYSWLNYGSGGVTGCLVGGLILQYYDANLIFYVMAFFGGLIGLSGIFMDLHLEKGSEDVIDMGLCKRSKFVFREVW